MPALKLDVCSIRHHRDMIAIMFETLTNHLPDDTLRQRKLAQGAWLFHQGDHVGSVYFVVAGCVELVRHTQAGKPAILQTAGSGAMLAEASVFSDRYHCDAIAAETSRILEAPRSGFLKLINSDPAFAAKWMEHLARQVQSARLRAEILTLKTVSQRLDAWLTFSDGVLPRRGERSILAKQIGVSPEALYREITRRKG